MYISSHVFSFHFLLKQKHLDDASFVKYLRSAGSSLLDTMDKAVKGLPWRFPLATLSELDAFEKYLASEVTESEMAKLVRQKRTIACTLNFHFVNII